MSQTSKNMESLPKQFVSAMRTLFDIMDDKNTGYVKLSDIENRWRDDRTKGLPHGVIKSLQKVASHDGLLTFENFCTGLKLCLLRNQTQNVCNRENGEKVSSHGQPLSKLQRSPQPPDQVLEVNEVQNCDRNWRNNDTSQHINKKIAHLINPKDTNNKCAIKQLDNSGIQLGPRKPPRLEINREVKDVPQLGHSHNHKPLMDETFNIEEANDEKIEYATLSLIIKEQDRGPGDGRSSNESQTNVRKTSRRREPRRHTLHNGVDYNLLKRMKQIEQEKDILLQGLSAVDEAREWYLKQLAEVQEKMRYAGRTSAYMEPWSEAHQERLELLRARVLELNRQLGALALGWRHGLLSLHMNLALPTTPPSTSHNVTGNADLLKSQNRILAEEVNRKNERISILEREKSTLIRELLLHRNNTKLGSYE